MTAPYDIAILVGSLRRGSYSSLLANTLTNLAQEKLTLRTVPIKDLPLYNSDDEADPPASYVSFREAIFTASGVLFVTPEYNRSIPGGLKNAIDVGSRPYGRNVFDGKPAAVVTHTPGAMGGFGANHAIRQSLVFLNMPTLQQPEAYIGHSDKLFDQTGKVIDQSTLTFLTGFMDAFAQWISRNAEPSSSSSNN